MDSVIEVTSFPRDDINPVMKSEPLPTIPIEMPETPKQSCPSLSYDTSSLKLTPKSSFIQSNISSSNYHLKSSLNDSQCSLREGILDKNCPYCSSESGLSTQNDSDSKDLSPHPLNLLYASELYLSSNNTINQECDISSVLSEEHATVDENNDLVLCEINEIINAINTAFNINNDQREEILDALASSLEQVAEETSSTLHDEEDVLTNVNPHEPVQGLDQIFVRAIIHEIMRFLSF